MRISNERQELGSASQHDAINLLNYWTVLRKYSRMIMVIVVTASIVAVIISLVLPKIYRAESVILPISANRGGALSSLLNLGNIASLVGINMPDSSGDANKFMTILRSRTLTEDVISRENLMPVLFPNKWDKIAGKWKGNDLKEMPSMEEAVRKLKKSHMKFMNNKKENIIVISSEFRDPELAAHVVNVYVDELQRFINDNAFTVAKRNRIFIEQQLEENKRDLLEAGKEINSFYRSKEVSNVEANLDVDVGVYTEELDNDKPKLAAFNDGKNPALTNLIAQKVEIEKKIAKAKIVQDVPQQVFLTYLMMHKELLAEVTAILTSQYEISKIEEAKEELAFQVIDRAVPPEKRIWPRRTQICVTTFIVSLLAAIFIALFREYIKRIREQEAQV